MSLLTQFYDCSGGGGDSGGGVTGSPTVVFGGQSLPPVLANGTGVGVGIYTYLGGGYTVMGFNSGQYAYATFNYINLGGATLDPTDLQYVKFNNCAVGQMVCASSTTLTGILGTGLVSFLSLYGTHPALTTFSTGISIISSSSFNTHEIKGAALDATSVNHIVTSVYDNGGAFVTSGSRIIDLSGGTSAGTSALTAAGTAAVAALTGAGWTVTLNP